MPQNKFIIAALLLTTSCNVTESYKAQKIDSDDKWNTQSSIPSDSKKISTEWWKNFGDEALNQLIAEAEKGNHDLKIATSRVREVRYETRSLTSSLLPEIGASANAKRSTDGYFFQNKKVDLFEAGFDASWEIDLWGGVQKKIEAKDAENKSLVFDKESVLKSLRAEVARNYFEYRNLQKQLELAQAQSDTAKQIYDILEAKSKSGLLSEIDVTGVRREYLDARSQLPDIEQNLKVTENRLNYLVGQKSGYLGKVLEGKKEINDITNSTFLSTPADVLATRPDVKSAEEVLVARTALKSSTITNLYPKISLSSFFGFQDTNLSKATDIWSLGAGITAPLINFGRIEADINAAEERQNQALENYKKTVLTALNEVEDSLVQYASMQTKMKLVLEAKNIAESNLALVQERYKRGISNYTEVLRARRDAMEAEQQLSNAKAGIANSIIAINKSLGI